MRLKVGDDFLDSDNSIIAQTYAVNEIGKIETSQGGFSNDFTLPLTDNNRAILGFPDDINSSSRNPYTKVEATLIDQGATVAQGYLKYQIVNNTQLQCSFFADNVNWFTLLKDKTLNDLDLSAYDHAWTVENIEPAMSVTKSDGYFYPFCDYGALSVFSQARLRTPYQANLLAGIYIHTLVTEIFESINWKITGDVTESAIYKKMIQPATIWAHSTEWQTDNSEVDASVTLPLAFTTTPTSITHSLATWTNESIQGVVTLKFTINATDPFTVRMTNGDTQDKEFNTPTGNQEYEITFDSRQFPNGGSGPTLLIFTTSVGTGNLIATSTISVQADRQQMIVGSTVQMSATMPNITQVDFINYISFLFGGIFQANPLSKTITWSFFRDVKKNLSSAEDWSNKIDLSKTQETNFTELIQNYGQISKIKYIQDDADANLVAYFDENAQVFGEGQLNLDNEHLIGIADIYTAPYAGTMSKNTWASNYYLPIIPFWTLDDDATGSSAVTQSFNPQPRVLILHENDITITELSGGFSDDIVISDGSGTPTPLSSIAFAYFAKVTQNITEIDDNVNTLAIDLPNLISITGTSIKTRFLEDYEDILSSMKYLKAFVHLTEVDISNLDFTIPVYIEQFKSYFYKSKILNYQGRKRTTEAELTKIG